MFDRKNVTFPSHFLASHAQDTPHTWAKVCRVLAHWDGIRTLSVQLPIWTAQSIKLLTNCAIQGTLLWGCLTYKCELSELWLKSSNKNEFLTTRPESNLRPLTLHAGALASTPRKRWIQLFTWPTSASLVDSDKNRATKHKFCELDQNRTRVASLKVTRSNQ